MKRKNSYRILKIIISLTILYVVYQNIDIEAFIETFKKANILVLLLGLSIGYILQIFIGGLRWYFSIKAFFNQGVNLPKLQKIFWEGMFVGYFLPASIGWDIYRVIEGKRLNVTEYKSIIIIIWEKLFGLASTLLLFFISFPFFKNKLTDPFVYLWINKLWHIGIVVTFSIIIILFLNRVKPLKTIFSRPLLFIEKIFENVFAKLFKKAKASMDRDKMYNDFTSIINTKGLVFFALSIIIKLLPAISTIIFFYAIGINISFSISVFATVVIIFIHMLPISFGSIGVREGAFIIVFGFFGIAPEEALTVSFFGLFSLIFTILMGGVSMLISNTNALLIRKKSGN